MTDYIRSIPCQKCLPDNLRGRDDIAGYWDVNRSEGIARCSNCGHARPFISKREGVNGKTPSQEKAIATIRQKVLEYDSAGRHEDHEYKQFEVRESDHGTIYVTTCVGRIGDDGTLAVIFRVYRSFSIGTRGGIKLLNPARFVKDSDGRPRKVRKAGAVSGRQALYHVTV